MAGLLFRHVRDGERDEGVEEAVEGSAQYSNCPEEANPATEVRNEIAHF